MISVYNSANLFIAPARGDRVRCEHSLLIPRDKLSNSFSSLLKFEQWHAGQRNCPLHSHITPFTPVEETRSPERRPIDRRSRDQLHLHFDQAIPAVVPHFCAGLSLYENFLWWYSLHTSHCDIYIVPFFSFIPFSNFAYLSWTAGTNKDPKKGRVCAKVKTGMWMYIGKRGSDSGRLWTFDL